MFRLIFSITLSGFLSLAAETTVPQNSDYLKKFIGAFECSLFSVNISLNGERLIATVPGQASCALKPEQRHCFSVEELPECSLQFVVESEGKISELHLHHAGHTFVLKAVPFSEVL